jgi:hypothetical protein
MFSAGSIAILIPVLIFMIPIIAILTSHQRRMAEIVHGGKNGNPGDIDALRREIHELKQLVHQQAISIDNLLARQQSATPPEIPTRIGS